MVKSVYDTESELFYENRAGWFEPANGLAIRRHLERNACCFGWNCMISAALVVEENADFGERLRFCGGTDPGTGCGNSGFSGRCSWFIIQCCNLAEASNTTTEFRQILRSPSN